MRAGSLKRRAGDMSTSPGYPPGVAMEQVPWLNEQETRAWRGFHALRSQLLGHLGRQLQADSGLSAADFEVLVFVSEAPSKRIRAVELGRRLGWEKSRLSKQVTRMEARGLLRREHCGSGARGADIVLTTEGWRVISAAAPVHLLEIRRLFIDLLTPDQLDALAAIAEVVLAHLDEEEGEDGTRSQPVSPVGVEEEPRRPRPR